MAETTSTTLAGLMPVIVADVQAIFKTQSALFNAVYSKEATNAHTVRFQSQAAPLTGSAISEGSQLTPVAITIGAVDAALQSYPLLARVSNQSILDSSTDVGYQVANSLAGNLALTMDTSIAALIPAFNGATCGATGSVAGVSDLLKGLALLDSTKYYGTKVVVMHPVMFSGMAKDLIAVAGMTREAIIQKGYVGTVFGAEIYVSPAVAVDSNGDSKAGIFFKEAGIGIGFHNPVINVSVAPDPNFAAQLILGESFYKAVTLNAGAGVTLVGKSN